MIIVELPDVLIFEWDKGNIGKNKKHDVDDQEAEDAFYDEQRIIFQDVKHSTKHSTKSEKRYILFGKTGKGKKLFIVFTLRGNQKEKVRIISARSLNRREVPIYEETTYTA